MFGNASTFDCIVVVLLHSFPLKRSVDKVWAPCSSRVAYHSFCTINSPWPLSALGVGNACCLPRWIMHQVLGLVFRYLLIRTNPNHSKPHMFAGMKEPFFWVIPIGAKTRDRLRSVRLGGGQWPLRNFVFVFWLPPSPASDLGP